MKTSIKQLLLLGAALFASTTAAIAQN